MYKTDREVLDEIHTLVKENNHMLYAARRAAFIGGIVKFVVWVVLLVVVPYYLYTYYLQPYLETLVSAYSDLEAKQTALENINLPEGFDFNKLFEQFTGKTESAE